MIPSTSAVHSAWKQATSLTQHGVVSSLGRQMPPSPASENRSLLVLSLTKVGLGSISLQAGVVMSM